MRTLFVALLVSPLLVGCGRAARQQDHCGLGAAVATYRLTIYVKR
jgi:hypothetical protein